MKARRRRGFTLVEVIVVLVILAILAAIAIPALTGYIDKAGTSRVRANAREAVMALQTLLSEAYADPATSLPTVSEVETYLYVDGEKFARIFMVTPQDTVPIPGAPDSGLYKIALDEGDSVHPAAFMRALTNAPVALEDDYSAFFILLVDKSFNIVGYLYLDPETFTTLFVPTGSEGLIVTYHFNLATTLSYDPTAGVNVWSYNMADGSATKVG